MANDLWVLCLTILTRMLNDVAPTFILIHFIYDLNIIL